MKPTNLNIIKNSLAIITIFKDESQSIFEWLLHHALEGVTQFVLLNNESRDKFREQILLFQKYWDKFIENKSEYSQVLIDVIESPGKYEQVSKLQKHTHLIKTQWFLSIDLDEFVYSRKGFKKITDYLDTIDISVQEIFLFWKNFGSNNIEKQPRSVINSFTKKQSYSNCEGNGKTLYRRGGRIRTPHRGSNFSNVRDSMNRRLMDSKPRPRTSPEGGCKNGEEFYLHLNHYALQSREFFFEVKATRGDVNNKKHENIRDSTYFNERNLKFNQEDDDELKKKRNRATAWEELIPKDRSWP